ncbi:MAG: flagellar hook-associated protein FlgK [Burkholderiaceae bacterium]|nr:flagellar hook-associated protein FlgK [Burkholderiaceae bacterium]
MTSSLLSIGKSGLLAAQVGMATTGHNISNANVVGYSRQTVQQGATAPQGGSNGFFGTGTEVTSIKRYYDNFLAGQVRAAQSNTSALDTYTRQISQIDNLLADPTSGLSPTLQSFFAAVQDVSANPASTSSRQALLSNANSLTSRFQSLSSRLADIGDGINTEIVSNVEVINSYAKQIADMNNKITSLSANQSNPPNDLLDQRDAVVDELNKYIKATVVLDGENRMTVSVGSGQPLVVGSQTHKLAATASATDPARMVVGYQAGINISVLPEDALNGGSLGALLDFRANSLDRVQNSLGRVAVTLAVTVNNQHKLGTDLSDNMGADFFGVEQPVISANPNNSSGSVNAISATISTDPLELPNLTTSNYKVAFDGTDFSVKRLPDGAAVTITTTPQTVDGVEYAFDASLAMAGDTFTIRPTVYGAAGIEVLVTDRSKIAAAAPLRGGAAPLTNTGSAKVATLAVSTGFLPATDPLASVPSPLVLTYDQATNTLSGFPAIALSINGVDTGAPGAPVPYTEGDVLSFGGVNVSFKGAFGDQDSISIEANIDGDGDNRNMALLGKLQTTNILDGGHATYQAAYAETVSFVGNKTREVQIDGAASAALLDQTTASQQAVSGVNLDEEAANLLRYQQAYQAAGKAMQIASQMFDTVLALGR